MSHSRVTFWLGILALLVCLPVGACNCNKTSSSSSEKDSEAATAKSAEGPKEEASSDDSAEQPEETDDSDEEIADAPPEDLYPGFRFSALDDEERKRFVEIARAELCPCPDATESLHVCLQKPDGRCRLAEEAAGTIGVSIKEGLNQTDILDRVAELIELRNQKFNFDLENAPRLGPKDAPVKIVEFADFQCPHCKQMSSVMHDLHEAYEDEVAIYFKHFPLNSHPKSRLAAAAAIAAHRQDKFWPMHDLIFESQMNISEDRLIRYAQQIGMNISKFKRDMKSPQVLGIIQSDRKEGDEAQISGTPAIFINGRVYLGERTEEGLEKALKAELESTTTDAKN